MLCAHTNAVQMEDEKREGEEKIPIRLFPLWLETKIYLRGGVFLIPRISDIDK